VKKLAQATLDYLMFLSVTDERKLDPDLAEESLDALRMHFEDASAEEKAALSAAAQAALTSATAVEDEDRHSSPHLLSEREREILGAIADGSLFVLDDEDDEDEEDWGE